MEHTESVVERAYAFVEDMLGLRPIEQRSVVQEADLTSEDPNAYTFQSVAELHVESRRRADGELTGGAHEYRS